MVYDPTVRDIFVDIYETNKWKSRESASGTGSTLRSTVAVRRELPLLLARYGVASVLDAPCGDFNWLSAVDLGDVQYAGADIVPALVEANERSYGRDGRTFAVLDASADDLPRADLVLCRDMLVHFDGDDIRATVANFKRSGAEWLLTTTFPGRRNRAKTKTGGWRPIDLRNFVTAPEPVELVSEEYSGKYADKCLGLWRLDDIEPVAPGAHESSALRTA